MVKTARPKLSDHPRGFLRAHLLPPCSLCFPEHILHCLLCLLTLSICPVDLFVTGITDRQQVLHLIKASLSYFFCWCNVMHCTGRHNPMQRIPGIQINPNKLRHHVGSDLLPLCRVIEKLQASGRRIDSFLFISAVAITSSSRWNPLSTADTPFIDHCLSLHQ